MVEVWRKEFEKTYSNGVNVDRYNGGDYVRDSTEYLWQGFLMAKRSQPVVVLPYPDHGDGFRYWAENEIDERLTAAGIKYTIGE